MDYNADGSYGGMCGNGGRCIAWFAYANKIAPKVHEFEALDHLYAARISSHEVILTMKDPKDIRIGEEITIDSGRLVVNSIDTGSPHVVVPVDTLPGEVSVSEVDVVGLGRNLRFNPHFSPDGTNVNFIERAGRNSIKIRTYERGVEDETLACGTGSIASAIVGMNLWGLKSPVTILPKSGVSMRVAFEITDNAVKNVRLMGPAAIVFEGSTNV